MLCIESSSLLRITADTHLHHFRICPLPPLIHLPQKPVIPVLVRLVVPLLLVMLNQPRRRVHLQRYQRIECLLHPSGLELVVLGQIEEDGVGVGGRVEDAPGLGLRDGEGFGHAVELGLYTR
jgi:hypothetical protein